MERRKPGQDHPRTVIASLKRRAWTRRLWALLWGGWAVWFLLFLATAWNLAILEAPSPTPLLEDRTGAYLAEARKDRDLGFWGVDSPNPKVAQALVAAEDVRFRWFPGIDPLALVRALWSPLTGGRSQGGSTIAMQVARLQSDHARTVTNKVLEMAVGVLLVLKFGHDRVLEHYLRIVPQGNRLFGVAYGARRYFHKPVEDLSWAEASLLAALPQAPGLMNPFSVEGFGRASGRAHRILGLLQKQGYFGEPEYREAVRELETMPLPRAETRSEETYHWVLRALEEEGKAPVPQVSRPRVTTLDPGVQAAAQETVRKLYEEHAAANVGNAAALVADRNGEILAYVGSYGYFDPLTSGGIDYIRTWRSSGSTLKPLLYALALDERTATPATVLADLPFSVLDPKGVYRPGNFDNDFLGPQLFRRALANSRNIPALRILEGIGLGRAYDRLAEFGLVHDDRGPDWYGYGLALGGLYVSLEDLVRAYGTLANDGREFRLRFFRDEQPSPGRGLISPYAARTVGLALSDDTARAPSFPRGGPMDFPWPVAVKTGTSQGYRDAWAIAYDGRFVAGVWLGNPDATPMNRIAGQVAAQGLRELLTGLEPLQAQGIDAVPFPLPEGTVAASVCVLSGQLAGPDCTSVSVERFEPASAPRDLCTVHVRHPVDVATGRAPTTATPADRVVLRPYTVLGPEYTLWSAQHGLVPPPTAPAGPRVLRLVAPLAGSRVFRDPETPTALQTLSLQVVVSPPVPAVDWFVDGVLWQSSPPPYSARWPLSPGSHTFQARLPGGLGVTAVSTVEVR